MARRRSLQVELAKIDAAVEEARRRAAERPQSEEARSLRELDAWMEVMARAVAESLLEERESRSKGGER